MTNSNALTLTEQAQLDDHEATITRGLNTFIEVGNALLAIRDGRLYRAGYATFEDYCRERWGMERRHAYRLMDGAMVALNVSHGTQSVPQNERHVRSLTELRDEDGNMDVELQRFVWEETQKTAPGGKVTAQHVESVVRKIRGREGNGTPPALLASDYNEWYTPEAYLEAARRVMGSIDLDPASSHAANQRVKAEHIFTLETDGLSRGWFGNVWLNPPYGRSDVESNQSKWSTYLIHQYESGNVYQSVLLVNAVTDRKWFQPLWEFPICFTDHRIRFYDEHGELGQQPTHGNALVYMGHHPGDFIREFSQFGPVVRKLT